jgi:hypothetical protein
MAGARKQTRFLRDDELLAEFEALSDNDTSNSESESEREVNESESDAEEICDNFESDSPRDAAQHTKRRTAGPSFQWQRGNFVPQIHDFDNQNSGISANLDENCSVFYIFKLFFFSFQILQHIAEQTNSYYNCLCQKLPPTPHSRLQSWAETTAEELYICDISHTCQILNYCGKW